MYEQEISDAAARWDVPESWIRAVIEVESHWNASAYNPNDPGGARGLMQMIAATAHGYGITDLDTLFIPSVAIDSGTHLLHDLKSRYGDDFRAVYSAYNSGKPTAWQTSQEVADHVTSALLALAEYETPAVGAGMLLLVGLLVFWVLKHKKG
jgi:soluble lytic murein transglycosylase-like protein